MSVRDDLTRAFTAAFRLERHDISEKPEGRAQQVAFVQLPGATRLRAARWHNGAWRTDRLKLFTVLPIAWFSVEVKGKDSDGPAKV